MIDTHCHIDLYPNPIQLLSECEKKGIITIGMTNLPSHFEMGYNHVLPYKKVRLSLGMHPLYAEQHEQEFIKFFNNLSKTSYIGEIGLDFSREGISTKEIQLNSFDKILRELEGKMKILSIHSRRAEKEVLAYLLKYNIKNAIFHWYSGSTSLIKDIVGAGYYFSINPAMLRSKNGLDIIQKIPLENVLTESDGPFVENNGIPIKPGDVKEVIDYLSKLYQKSFVEIENQIAQNFKKLINNIR